MQHTISKLKLHAKKACLLAAAAAALSPAAHAALVTVNLNTALDPLGNSSTYVSPDGGHIYAYTYVSFGPNGDAALWGYGTPATTVETDGSGNLLNLAPGSTVGPTGTFENIGAITTAQFPKGSTGYAGFDVNGTYGYVTLDFTSPDNDGRTFTIDSYTYDDSGASVTIPGGADPAVTPEPSLIGVLALGMVGMGAAARKKFSALV